MIIKMDKRAEEELAANLQLYFLKAYGKKLDVQYQELKMEKQGYRMFRLGKGK